MKPPVWSNVETEALADFAINYPPNRLLQLYNSWAGRNGHPKRSRHAILTKLRRIGVSASPSGDWISSHYIWDVLGVGPDTTQRWTTHYGIACHRGSRNARFFCRADLQRVASERPETFAGISADRLFLLLEDRSLADAIAAAHPRRAMQPRPVRAIETGWRYPSVRAAAAHIHIARQAIQRAIRTGGTAAGYHWIYA